MPDIFAHDDPRFWNKVNFDGPKQDHMADNCWLWGAGTNGNYGVFLHRLGDKKSQGYAHRYIWEQEHGQPIPPDKEIDHICYIKLCVRPNHLDLTTRHENMIRYGERKTHCPVGHEYNEKNTYYRKSRNGRRQCRVCDREAKAKKGMV